MSHNKKQPESDFSKVLNTALSGFTGMFGDAKKHVNAKVENYLAEMDIVKREEFEVLKEMVAQCRKEQIKILEKLEKIEKSQK
jgi:BMFP domain-containing protein YqiC